MKKYLSLLLSVMMILSCLTVSPVLAEEFADEIGELVPAETLSEECIPEEILEEEETDGEDAAQLNAVDYAVLDELASAIAPEMLTSGNEPADKVTRNLDMSLAGDLDIPDGVTVEFSSSDTSVITDDGAVVRSFEEDKTVTVTATVSDGETGVEKAMVFTVLKADTLVLYSDNFYYPEAVGKEIIGFASNAYTSILPGSWKYGPFTQNPSTNVSSQIKFADGEYVVDYKRLNTEAGTELNLNVPIQIDANSPNYSKIKFSMTLKPVTYTATTQRIDFALLAKNAKLIDWFVFKSTSIQNNLQSPTQNLSQTNTGFNTVGDNKIDVIIDYEAGTYTNVMNGRELEPMRLPTGMETLKLNYMTIGLARWQVNPAEFYLKDIAVTTEVDLEKPENILTMISEDAFSCNDASAVYEDFTFEINSSLTDYLESIGATVSLSSDSSLIEIDGNNLTVIPSEEKEDVTVTLSIAKEGEVAEKTFTFTVYNPASLIRDGITIDMFNCPDAGEILDDFSFVPSDYIDALLFETGATVTLTSNSDAIEFDGYNAYVTRTEEVQDAVITVTVSKDGITARKTFDMSVYNLLPADIFEISVPEITDNGTTVTASVEITCTDVVDVNAKVTFVLVLRNKVSGKIASINYDTATLAKDESDVLSTVLASLGDEYEPAYYFWDDIENAVPVTNAPPAEPGEIDASDITMGSARISWSKADDDGKAISYYNVYRDGNKIASTEETAYVVENLDFGSIYNLSVTAVDKAGNESIESIEIDVETMNIPTVILQSDDPVNNPEGVQNSDRLSHVHLQKGYYAYTEVCEVEGRLCRKTIRHIRDDGTIVITRFHFKAETSYITPKTKEIVVEITYFDEGTAPLNIETQGGGGVASALTNTGCWKTHTFFINSAAYTAAGAYDGANFRIYTQNAENFRVYSASIAKQSEYRKPAASLKVTDVITLREMLFFKNDNLATLVELDGAKALKVENGKHIEIDVQDSAIDSSKNEVSIEITYLDDSEDTFTVEYASKSGISSDVIQKTGSGKWKTALIKVDDAKFDGSMKGATNRNLDMRISGETTLYVTTVKAY